MLSVRGGKLQGSPARPAAQSLNCGWEGRTSVRGGGRPGGAGEGIKWLPSVVALRIRGGSGTRCRLPRAPRHALLGALPNSARARVAARDAFGSCRAAQRAQVAAPPVGGVGAVGAELGARAAGAGGWAEDQVGVTHPVGPVRDAVEGGERLQTGDGEGWERGDSGAQGVDAAVQGRQAGGQAGSPRRPSPRSPPPRPWHTPAAALVRTAARRSPPAWPQCSAPLLLRAAPGRRTCSRALSLQQRWMGPTSLGRTRFRLSFVYVCGCPGVPLAPPWLPDPPALPPQCSLQPPAAPRHCSYRRHGKR